MNPLLTQALVAPHIDDLRRSACLSGRSSATSALRPANAIARSATPSLHGVAPGPRARLITTLIRDPLPRPCDAA